MKNILITFVALALSSCTSAEERAHEQMSQCLNMGYVIGTQAFAECRLQLESIDFQRRQAMAAAFSQGMNSAGQMYQQQPIQVPTTNPYTQKSHCQTQPNSGGYATECW